MKFSRLKQIFVKELIQLSRDPKMRVMVLFVPVFTMVMCGYALNIDIVRTPTIVLDNDHTPESRELIEHFSGTEIFQISDAHGSFDKLTDALNSGNAEAGIIILPGYAKNVRRGRGARIQVVTDGTKILDAASVILAASEISINLDLHRAQLSAPMAGEMRALFNNNMDSRIDYLPGLIGCLLMMQSLSIAGLSIVKRKEVGTIEQVMVTPISSMEFIFGKTLPYLFVGYLVLAMCLAVGWLCFDLPFRGSMPGLILLSGLFMAGNLGMALTISNSSNTQQEALLTSAFLMVPMGLLSGFVFPVMNMPPVIQFFSLFNPLAWYIVGAKIALLKGGNFASLNEPMFALGGLSLCYVAFAMLKFKKQVS